MSTLKVNEIDSKTGTTITVTAGKTIAGTDIIDTAQIKANAITATELATDAITADKILADSITTAKILNANVTTDKILDANVTTAKILDNNVTVAKIAGSAAAAADTYLKKDGTWSTVASGTTWQAVKTASFTAVAGEGYPCNTTAAGFTVTLPTPPTAGDTIEFVDYAGTFDSNALFVAPGGSDKLKGATTSQVMKTERSGASLTFFDATQGWIPTSGINEGTAAMGIPTYSVEVLMTAGGGSGTTATTNGGGGGGGLLYYGAETPKTPNGIALVLQTADVYTVTIGAGGDAGSNGNDTVFSGGTYTGGDAKTAVAGGQGNAVAGGSGGGHGHGPGSGGAGTAGQGFAGGSAVYASPGYPGGGGGGAGAVGGNASGGNTPGNGGAGLNYVITGSSVNYAAGGGGGGYASAGYGAAGGNSAGAGNVAAPDGRGGGGGVAKAGGDGCIILRMLTTDYTGTTTGSPTVSTDGSYKVINFTASGSYTG